jgi:hypothetical protein
MRHAVGVLVLGVALAATAAPGGGIPRAHAAREALSDLLPGNPQEGSRLFVARGAFGATRSSGKAAPQARIWAGSRSSAPSWSWPGSCGTTRRRWMPSSSSEASSARRSSRSRWPACSPSSTRSAPSRSRETPRRATGCSPPRDAAPATPWVAAAERWVPGSTSTAATPRRSTSRRRCGSTAPRWRRPWGSTRSRDPASRTTTSRT